MRTILEKIGEEAERLSPEELLELVEKLVHQLREKGLTKEDFLDWNDLYGIGRGLWNEEDAQEYVNQLRKDRE